MMPSEPDNKMDELLRTYARKRREDAGAPPELHPATRRLLQAEAAKLRPRPDAGRRTGWMWLVAHWPRVAISAGLFAVLGVVVWNSVPGRENSSSRMMLAQGKRSLDAPAPTDSTPAPAAAPTDRLATDKLALGVEQDRGGLERADAGAKLASEPSGDRNGPNLRRRAVLKDEAQTLKKEKENAVRQAGKPDAFVNGNANRAIAPVTVADATKTQLRDTGATSFTYANDAFGGGRVPFGGAGAAGGMAPARDATTLNERSPALAKGAPALSPAAPQFQNPDSQPALSVARQNSPRPTAGETIAPPASPPPPQAAAPALRTRGVTTSPAPTASEALARIESVAEPQSGATAHYRFRRESGTEGLVGLKQQTAPTAPLSTFEFEQAGDSVRVIDQDGSVYAGRLLSAESESRARLGEVEAVSEDKRVQVQNLERRKLAGDAEAAPRFYAPSGNGRWGTNVAFRVIGTNRTSGQRISFEGTFSDAAGTAWARETVTVKLAVAPAPAPAPSPAPPALGPPAGMPAGAVTAPGNAPESRRLLGRLRIGASNEITIIAVPSGK